jgi:hypothetical protein
MPERDADESLAAGNAAPHTPRVSSALPTGASSRETPLPESGMQSAERATDEAPAVSEPGDTLLSAGKPADRLELLLEDRLAGVDERMRELDARLAVLEQKQTKQAPTPQPLQRPWLWIAFLIGLVLIFQLLRRLP